MTILQNWQQVEKFKEIHKDCPLHYLATSGETNQIVIRCDIHSNEVITSIPYVLFCRHPLKCAGRNSCPREYSCCE